MILGLTIFSFFFNYDVGEEPNCNTENNKSETLEGVCDTEEERRRPHDIIPLSPASPRIDW